MAGSLTILSGFDSNKWLKADFRKAETAMLENSPLTDDVQEAIRKVFGIDPQNVDKEHWLEILESRDADLISNLYNPKVASLRIAYPMCQLHEKGRRAFTEMVCEQVANGRKITLLISDSIVLNTTLLAFKRGILTKENLTIWFYPPHNSDPELIELTTETTGCIDFQPKGFFDEEEDLFYDLGGFDKEKLKS